MRHRLVSVILGVVLAVCVSGSRLDAQGVVTHLFPGITHPAITCTHSGCRIAMTSMQTFARGWLKPTWSASRNT